MTHQLVRLVLFTAPLSAASLVLTHPTLCANLFAAVQPTPVPLQSHDTAEDCQRKIVWLSYEGGVLEHNSRFFSLKDLSHLLPISAVTSGG